MIKRSRAKRYDFLVAGGGLAKDKPPEAAYASAEEFSKRWVPIYSIPLTLEFKRKITLNTIHLTFDTNLCLCSSSIPPLSKIPQCVKDYVLEYRMGEKWKRILKIKDNYQRKRVHTFPEVRASRIRVKVEATQGSKAVHIYEIRVYNTK